MHLLNKIKKAVALGLTMAMAMSCVAFAAYSDCSITVDNTTTGKSYSIYKIFDATYAVDSESQDATGAVTYTLAADSPWVEVFFSDNTGALVQTGESAEYFTLQAVYKYEGGEKVVDYYAVQFPSDTDEEWNTNLAAWLAALIEDMIKNSTLPSGITAVATETGNGGKITFENLDAGYYFVTSGLGAVVSITSASPDAVIIDKNQTPGDLKKVMVVEEGEDVVAEAEGMDEDVTFDITAHVPMYDGEKVVTEYIFNDTMSDGILIELTGEQFTAGTGENSGKYFLSSDMIDTWITLTDAEGNALGVKFSEVAYDYSVELLGYDTYTDETGESVHTFTGFILTYYTYNVSALASAEKAGEDVSSVLQSSTYPTDAYIEIKYTAHTTSLEGYDNTNDIVMQWRLTSWKAPDPENPEYPDYDGDGNPDGPDAGLTAHDDVYSWELELIKTDGADESPLEGATFTLESEDMKAVSVGHSYVYYLVSAFDEETGLTADGQDITTFESTYYYKTSDDENADWTTTETEYGPYLRKLSDKQITIIGDETVAAEGTTDSEGKLYFAGLGIGTYTLTEIKSPDGYNLLESPIEFEISWTEADGFTVTITSGLDETAEMTDGYILTLDIENNAGLRLPSTGGMGTTIFYAVGICLLMGCAVAVIVRRRMHSVQ